MRHLWSLLAGVVAAPLAWILVTLGQDGSARVVSRWMEVGTFNTANLIEPAVYLAVAGILLGLLGTLRVSPAGPLVAGLLLIAPYVGLFVSPYRVRDAVPGGWKVLGDPLPLHQPLDNGTLLLIGLMLLMATFSVQRWRRWPDRAGSDPSGESTDSRSDDDRATLADWPPSTSGNSNADADTPPLGLGYPPLRPEGEERESGSPWSAPPRTAKRETSGR